MKYNLHLENGNTLVYDSFTCSISTELPKDKLEYPYSFDRYCNLDCTSETKNGKYVLETVKLLFGLNCNYNCLYCNQSTVKETSVAKQDIDAAKRVIDAIAEKYEITGHIELWGGEPFVYWKTIKELVPYIRQYFSKAPISVITNGSLLDLEKAEFCKQYSVYINISHDGPAQTITRNSVDVLSIPKFQDAFKLLVEEDLFQSFHFVISNQNANLYKVVEWFDNNVYPGVCVSTEGIVGVYSYNKQHFPPFNKTEQAMLMECFNMMAKDENPRFNFVHRYVESFNRKLNKASSVKNIQYPFGCNDPDDRILSIDLKGNVLSCHAEPANILKGLGNVLRTVHWARKKDTFIGWQKRPNCKDCIGLSTCHGGCGVISDEEHALYCPNRWLQCVASINGSMGRLFDTRLTSISRAE